MGIESWSTTAASNNAASPNGAPEGMAPSGVNDTIRQTMASLRAWYEDAQWVNLGHTPTRIDNDTFTVATDLTSLYHAGRRLKVAGSATGYCSIASSSYSAPNTTVNVTMDSGNLPATLSTVYLSLLTATNQAVPGSILLDQGSLANLTLAYHGDTDTGIGKNGTDQLSMVANGVERHRSDGAFGNTLSGGLRLSGLISPSQITANQNDYAPAGIDTAIALRLSSNANINITGLQTSTVNDRLLFIINVGSFNILLANVSSLSASGNRFAFGSDITLGPSDGITLFYDSVNGGWRAVGVKL